jgi:predicted acyl esterase
MPRLTAVVSLCLLAVLTLSAGVAQAANPFTKKALVFAVENIGPNNDQTCRVEADLYTPAGVSQANPAPAVMATNGFGGNKGEFNSLGASYAKRGYVFLAYSGLGFGSSPNPTSPTPSQPTPGSGCKITLDDPDFDGKAASRLVDFLGGTKAAQDGTKIDYVARDAVSHDGVARGNDPRMGMIGGSYGGEIQFSLAGQDPRVDALVPQITWHELSYSLAPNNTDFTRGVQTTTPGVLKLDWPVLFTAVGLADTFAPTATGDTSHLGQCPNFSDQVCRSLVESAARGYPTDDTRALLHHASVSNYIQNVKIPTLLSQGQNDNLFNLQEATATYRILRGQGTPVKMLWRSAGHSGGDIGTSETNSANPETSYESRMALEWFDFYLRGLGDAPPLDFSFLTDWIPYTAGKDAAASVGSTPSFPASTDTPLYLSGGDALTGDRAAVKKGSAQFAATPVAPSSVGGGLVEAKADTPPADAPGTSVSFTGAPLPSDFDVVGASRLSLKLDAPVHQGTQGADPGGKLVVFAKLYDVDPAAADPSKSTFLPRNLISAARVADVTKPFTIELPGIVHRFPKGHQMRLTLATSAAAYRGNNIGGPITLAVDPAAPPVLTVPKLGLPAGAFGAGPGGTTPFTPPAQAPPTQKPGGGQVTGAKADGIKAAAAALPSGRKCVSRRAFRIRIRKAPKGDRLRSAVVTVNGKRVKTLKGKRLSAPVSLKGLPKGTFRVTVTAKTKRGKTLRSARTYRTCLPKKK